MQADESNLEIGSDKTRARTTRSNHEKPKWSIRLNSGPNGRGRSSEPTLVSRNPVEGVAADGRAAVAAPPPPHLRDLFFVAALVFFGVCRRYRRRREQQQDLRCEIGMADSYQEKFLLSDPSPSPDPPHGYRPLYAASLSWLSFSLDARVLQDRSRIWILGESRGPYQSWLLAICERVFFSLFTFS